MANERVFVRFAHFRVAAWRKLVQDQEIWRELVPVHQIRLVRIDKSCDEQADGGITPNARSMSRGVTFLNKHFNRYDIFKSTFYNTCHSSGLTGDLFELLVKRALRVASSVLKFLGNVFDIF